MSVTSWLEERAGFVSCLEGLRRQAAKPVPTGLSWVYTMGTLAAFFFALQFVTGFLLTMVYVPDESLAFSSVQSLEHEVSLGWLIRQMHAWGASFIIIALIFHVFQVLWHGSYKRPREFTWFVGFVLLILTLAFCLSGYLLPWSQLSFWATRVAVEAVDSVPLVGEHLKSLICGGPDVSGRTLGRFFSLPRHPPPRSPRGHRGRPSCARQQARNRPAGVDHRGASHRLPRCSRAAWL